MPRERLSMRKITEVLRLRQAGLSNRAIARACSISKETVREYLARAAEAPQSSLELAAHGLGRRQPSVSTD
jgi:response regulator of citrate/malate metabolism